MKTKEISFTLPVVITLYEFMFFEGKIKKRILYLIPFLFTMLIIPLSLIEIDKPIGDAIGELREAAQEIEEISRWSYLFTQFRVIVTYIRLLFLPINQNLDYDYPIYHSFFEPNVFLSFLFILLVSGIGFYLLYRSRVSHPEPKAKGLRDSSATPQTCPERDDKILPLNQVQGQNDRKRRNDINIPTRYTLHPTCLTAFGIFWFFITLSVESSIIPIRDVIFEHRVYLPSVGAIMAFVFTIFYILRFIASHLLPHVSRIFLTTAYLLLTTAIVVFSIATYQRNIVWQDEVTLWEDVAKKSPEKVRVYYNLGKIYSTKGWTDKAIENYQIALRFKPDFIEAHNNLGNAYNEKGWIDKAIEHYQIAIWLWPDYPEAHNNIGNAYAAKGWIDKAIEHYWFALRLKPDFIEAHNNLGNVYNKKGWIDKAIEHYQIAIWLGPDYPIAHNNIGNAYAAKGWIDKAIEHYWFALRLKPDFIEAHNNLGVVYERKGLLEEAIKEYQTALMIDPEFKMARDNLNKLLRIKGK